jgi:hypothetical protein
MDATELTEYEIMQMTPPQFAEHVSLEICDRCDLADVCDGTECLIDLAQKAGDYLDEQRQAWRPI